MDKVVDDGWMDLAYQVWRLWDEQFFGGELHTFTQKDQDSSLYSKRNGAGR